MAQRGQLYVSSRPVIHNDQRTIGDESSPLLPPAAPDVLESQSLSLPAKIQSVPTPLPKAQLICLCAIRLVDPIAFTQIFPYINEMMAHLHLTNDPLRVGFYSGLAESAFSISSLFSIYQWARLSGTIVCCYLILDLLLTSLVLLSRRNRSPTCHFHRYYRSQFSDITFWLTADASWNSTRSLHWSVTSGRHQSIASLTSITAGGFFSGNTAVIYSVLGEITDSTNQAIALPIFAVAWPVGSVIG
jgi:hypothetical protein